MIGSRLGLGLAIIVLATVLDQITKWFMADWLVTEGRLVPVTSFFDFVLVYNRGASFGLFQTDSPWGPWLLAGFTVIVVVALVVWMFRTDEGPLTIALSLIIGGALGNLIDRVMLGKVVDFLYFHIGEYYWPAFNLADSAITVGVAIILFGSLIGGRSDRRLSAEPEDH